MISVVPALDALVLRFGHTAAENYPALYAWRSRVLDVLARTTRPRREAQIGGAKECRET